MVTISQQFALNSTSGVTVPAPASSAGYNTAVLSDDFTSNTFGSNWYPYSLEGTTPLSTGVGSAGGTPPTSFNASNPGAYIDPTNSWLVVQTDNSGYSAGVTTISSTSSYSVSTPSSHVVSGSRCFQYGYFECRMKFVKLGWVSGADPAFWLSAVAGPIGAGGTTQFPYVEIDMPEWFYRGGGAQTMTTQVFSWNGGGGSQFNNSGQILPNYNGTTAGEGSWILTLPSGFDFNNFNKYGCLWTPTTLNYYLNDVLVCTVPTSTTTTCQDNTGATISASYNAALNSNTPRSQCYLMIGTGVNWPVTVDYIQVWQ